MINLDRKIKDLSQELKDLPFKINQYNRFLKASLLLGIKDLIDFKNYL